MLTFILGRQPELSRAELVAVFPDLKIVGEGAEFLVADGIAPEEVDLKKIGGIVKVGEVFLASQKFSVEVIIDFLVEWASGRSGKINFGISVSGAKFNTPKTLLIGVKKGLRERGISARFANKDFQNLTSAQVELNGLTKDGVEILVTTNGREWWYAVTLVVQPFDAYRKRDYEKAVRDARIGMLPPKLAQILINLGNGQGSRVKGQEVAEEKVGIFLEEKTINSSLVPRPSSLIYDPFCGTGTVLIEAALMGHVVVGSDVNEKMVEASQQNLAALNLTGAVFSHDARKFTTNNLRPTTDDEKRGRIKDKGLSIKTGEKPNDDRQPTIYEERGLTINNEELKIKNQGESEQSMTEDYLVVTEGYLGPPFKLTPDLITREKVFRELAGLYRDFFAWIQASVIVITFPVYLEKSVPKYFSSSVLVPEIQKLGWKIAHTKKLVYSRPDQIVGREIVIFVRGNNLILFC